MSTVIILCEWQKSIIFFEWKHIDFKRPLRTVIPSLKRWSTCSYFTYCTYRSCQPQVTSATAARRRRWPTCCRHCQPAPTCRRSPLTYPSITDNIPVGWLWNVINANNHHVIFQPNSVRHTADVSLRCKRWRNCTFEWTIIWVSRRTISASGRIWSTLCIKR